MQTQINGKKIKTVLVVMEDGTTETFNGGFPVEAKPKAKKATKAKAAKAKPDPDAPDAIRIPIEECIGCAAYLGGRGYFPVAIFKTGMGENNRRFYKLLFIDEQTNEAFHKTDADGFFGSSFKLRDISWKGGVAPE